MTHSHSPGIVFTYQATKEKYDIIFVFDNCAIAQYFQYDQSNFFSRSLIYEKQCLVSVSIAFQKKMKNYVVVSYAKIPTYFLGPAISNHGFILFLWR